MFYDDKSPQKKILNKVIPILMYYLAYTFQKDRSLH